MPTMYDPDTGNTAEVPSSDVEGWQHCGWTLDTPPNEPEATAPKKRAAKKASSK